MIDLLATPEQQQIADSVAEFLAAKAPVARLREGGGAGVQVGTDLWRDMAALGWFGLGVPEAAGGVGYGVVEELLVARELGRHLASPSVVAAMVGAHVAAQSRNAALYERIASGRCRVALAQPLASKSCHLIDAADAELVLVCNEHEVGLYPLDAFTDVMAVTPLDDSTALQSACWVAGASTAVVGEPARALNQRFTLLVAGQLVGVAEGARDLAVEYAKVRMQFGQAIGAFQAIKHLCADMAVAAEAAYAQCCYAALSFDAGLEDARFQTSAAALLSVDSALANARSGIQIHGGIGFTQECDAHWFLKRAHLLEYLVGERAAHREVLLGLEVEP